MYVCFPIPLWLLINQLIAPGKHEEGRHIIWALQPNARYIAKDDAVVNIEMDEINRAIIDEHLASSEASFKMVFKNGPQRFLHQTLLGMGGQMMQQMSGVNLIAYVSILRFPVDVCNLICAHFGSIITVIFEQSVGMDHNTALLVLDSTAWRSSSQRWCRYGPLIGSSSIAIHHL